MKDTMAAAATELITHGFSDRFSFELFSFHLGVPVHELYKLYKLYKLQKLWFQQVRWCF